MTVEAAGELTLRPSAARLLESMRDIGYSFESALADIVDNSISAGAESIDIVNDVDPRIGAYLAILDDGVGMSPAELTQAMQHGSRSPRDERASHDLGRFGLGMKTASFSQCRSLTVIARKDGELAGRRWDLDLVVERDEWILKVLDEKEIGELPHAGRLGAQGVLVLWQQLDRLDALGDEPHQIYAALDAMFAGARPHLALTFHRFIAPEPSERLRPVVMRINGAALEALDPFARLSSPSSDPHAVETLHLGSGEMTVQAFTLPHHERLTKDQMAMLELGSSLMETQGLYIYRARRLITGGTWMGLARRSELTKLLRVRVDIPTSLDVEWNIDVRKSRVKPPAIVKNKLRPLVDRMTDSARRPYTYRGTKQAAGPGFPLWTRRELRGEVRYELARDHPLVMRVNGDSAWGADLEPLLLAIEASLPLDSIFSDMGSDPHAMTQGAIVSKSLEQLIAGFVDALAPNSPSITAALADRLLQAPMFAGRADARTILERLRTIEL